jgi:5'-deoxynucleotidase YfbR-like HD superfamily hydrolase
MEKTLNLLIKAGKLKKIKRTGWLNKGISDCESVADHSYRLSVLVMLFSEKLSLNTSKLLKMALIHDLVEAETGDILSHEKNGFEEEKEIALELFSGVPEFYSLWEEFEKGETEEAIVLKQLDKLEMIIQSLEYKKEGHEGMEEFLENKKKITHPLLKEFLGEIERERNLK